MKRARRERGKLKTFLGRVVRDILRKYPVPDERLALELSKAQRLLAQQRHDKHKLYSIHASEVECIAKGKAHKRYEFGNKVSFVTISKDNWIVGVQSLQGNPYDGHTRSNAITQVETLTGKAPETVYCDAGYRGHDYKGEQPLK